MVESILVLIQTSLQQQERSSSSKKSIPYENVERMKQEHAFIIIWGNVLDVVTMKFQKKSMMHKSRRFNVS